MELYAAVPDTLNPPCAGRSVATLKVCGVFSSALYMESSPDSLYLLHSNDYGLLPFGFGVRDIKYALALLNTDVGEVIRWVDEMLVFPNGTTIFLRKTALPEIERSHGCHVSAAVLQRAIQILRDSGRGAVPGLVTQENIELESQGESVFTRIAHRPLQGLLSGFRENSPTQIRLSLEQLIGLGPGLTPSMDDFLTGTLCTLHYADRYWGIRIPSSETLSKAVQMLAPERTGKYSKAYLMAAAQGQRFQLIEKVLSTFSEDAVLGLMAVGGHSGADMLTGLLWTMEHIVKGVK